MRFVAIVHAWHVSSQGFMQKELETRDLAQAHKEGAALAYNQKASCRATAYTLVAIEDHEVLVSRRKLTWKERFTGILDI